MVYSKELERDVTGYRDGEGADAPENVGIIPSYYVIGLIFLRPKDECGLYCTCHV